MSIHPHPVAVIHRVFAVLCLGLFSMLYFFLWSFPQNHDIFFENMILMAVLSSVFLNLLKLFCLLLGA